MAGYSDLRQYTDPRPDSEPKPRIYTTDISIVDHTGAETHNGNGVYSNGSSLGLIKGYSIYVKPGSSVAFYEDSKGKTQVGPSGGKGGQAKPPSRSGVDTKEFVGIFTGKATNEFIEVSWVNSWWQDTSWKVWRPFAKIEKGHFETESKVSWVRISNIDWQADYVPPSERDEQIRLDKELKEALDKQKENLNTSSGIDSTTLGLLAIGGAFLLKKKKRK